MKMVGFIFTSWPALPGKSHSALTLLEHSCFVITQPRDELFFTEKNCFSLKCVGLDQKAIVNGK